MWAETVSKTKEKRGTDAWATGPNVTHTWVTHEPRQVLADVRGPAQNEEPLLWASQAAPTASDRRLCPSCKLCRGDQDDSPSEEDFSPDGCVSFLLSVT